jgi:hypothetical protein
MIVISSRHLQEDLGSLEYSFNLVDWMTRIWLIQSPGSVVQATKSGRKIPGTTSSLLEHQFSRLDDMYLSDPVAWIYGPVD